ncbi:MAG TPA: alkaline phosphatase family protein [Polyangiaceae bacterium]|nr:alkaline phosphatase family protein [Polyangiaceae bacterium]
MSLARGLVFAAIAGTATCVPARDPPLSTTSSASPSPATPALALGASARLAGHEDSSPPSLIATETPRTPVILVVLDGVRWQEVFEGADRSLTGGWPCDARSLFPYLYAALDARGAAIGAPGHGTISASGPNYVSLPGYTEIFGGKAPESCQDNACSGASGATLVDAMRDRAARNEDVAVIASWGPIARAATHSAGRIALSTGREHVTDERAFTTEPGLREAMDRGAQAGPWPGHDTFRPDRYTADIALRYLAVHAPDFLFVGLGEPDEFAHTGDYLGYLGALRAADTFFGQLFATLEGMGDRGRRTLVVVTADHGRGARDYRDHGRALPDSGRVWLMAIGGPVRARGFVDAIAPRHLADVAPTLRDLAGLPPADPSPHSGLPMVELAKPAPAHAFQAQAMPSPDSVPVR